jgi:precorrin-6Y C5,15-methyltransferase (decarboxylating)
MTAIFWGGHMPKPKVHIIGVAPGGASGLPPEARRLINSSEKVFGGKRLLDMFPAPHGEKIVIDNNLAEVTDLIKQNLGRKRIVVLASGDPNLFGIASYLIAKLGKGDVEIIPNVSSMQVAFARIKESWENAVFVSVHARPIEDIVAAVRLNNKIGIFTDEIHTPAAIAQALMEHGVDGYRAYVCQNLGGKDEQVMETDLAGLGKTECSPLNILILLREQSQRQPQPMLGIPEADFYRRRDGLITKQEVRAVSLAKMRLTDESVLWDIGAGSGAISIEASFLARKGRVYAVEKNDADVAIIRKNIRKFQTPNIEVVQALAPEGLDKLPDPTAVFIGGSGGRMEEIIDLVTRRLKLGGRIVINALVLENLSTAVNALKARGFIPDITLVNVARSQEIASLTRLEALNPVFVIAASKKEASVPYE